MAAPTREAIDVAVFAKITAMKTAGDIKTASRVWKAWADVPANEQPAIFLVKMPENKIQDKGSPPLNFRRYDLVVYTNTGQDIRIIRATQINTVLDKLDVAFAPDAVTGFQDLGGVVSHAWIVGETTIVEGTLGEQAVMVVPLEVHLNQSPGPSPSGRT